MKYYLTVILFLASISASAYKLADSTIQDTTNLQPSSDDFTEIANDTNQNLNTSLFKNDTIYLDNNILSITDSLYLENDSINMAKISFSANSSAIYLQQLLNDNNFWKPGENTMKNSLQRLLNQYLEAYDSISKRLNAFRYDSIMLYNAYLYENDTIPLRWLNDSTMIIDTVAFEKNPFITKKTIILKNADVGEVSNSDTLEIEQYDINPNLQSDFDSAQVEIDSVLQKQSDELLKNKLVTIVADTILEVVIDTSYLESKNIQMYRMIKGKITPPVLFADSNTTYTFSSDMSNLIFRDSSKVITSSADDPFLIFPGLYTTDSLGVAVKTLINHIYDRDSVQVFLQDMQGDKTPLWLTTNNDELSRFWIKNYRNNSITIWVGNPEKFDISLFLEEEVRIDRPEKRPVQEIPIPRKIPQSDLEKVEPLALIPVFWNYDVSTMFAFNQTFLSNWAKGGESSVATMLDIKGKAQYNNKQSKTKWINNGRLKYGSIVTEEYGLRTNTDQFELNSQFNKVIDSKIDFSTVFYMKNQIAKGYNYPNDSVPVSKFLNPGTFTLGTGIEYKPIKKTLINLSPLSYKNTFVLDTAEIDQTNHGIDADKRTRQEMGGQIVVKNSLTLLEGLDMSNSIRLFTNYFSKPINMDVDWEMNLEKRVNWYFTIGLNLHIIYDNDIKFPVLDDAGEAMLGPDGNALKEPKIQFKEFIGLNFSFKF